MRFTTCHIGIATTLLSVALVSHLCGQVAPPPDDAALRRPAAAERLNLGLRGVYFVENQGQWGDGSVHYGLKSRGLDVAFRDSSFTLHLSREVERVFCPFEPAAAPGMIPTRERGFVAVGEPDPLPHGLGSHREPATYEHLTLTVSFPGSNPVAPRGALEQTAKFNYFVGGEGRGIASNVPSFGAVIYEDLYDGINLLVCGNDDGVMKYEFHCAPGADYTQIRIHYDGVDSLCVNADGDLEIATRFGTLRDGAPIVWQEEDGGSQDGGTAVSAVQLESGGTSVPPGAHSAWRHNGRGARSTAPTLPARFRIIDDNSYRIAIDGPVDLTRLLIIDPEVEWMYYLGGGLEDDCSDVVVDVESNGLVTGSTASSDFEGRNNQRHGGTDAFAAKMSEDGVLLWMTYLGGSDFEYGSGIAIDAQGNASVAGVTSSRDFEGRMNSHHGGSLLHRQDAFVARVGSDGALLWMTYLGGNGDDAGMTVATDTTGDALIAGVTHGGSFEGANNWRHGNSDAFLVRVSAVGALQWMTYLGGSEYDQGSHVFCDDNGNALVSGYSNSTDFEGRSNGYHGGVSDAFVASVSAGGTLQWMTYLGGSLGDNGWGVGLDSSGSVFVAGDTWSVDFEGRMNAFHGGFNDAYVLRLIPPGTLQWMRYLGGTDVDSSEGSVCMVVDGSGTAVVAGATQSLDFEGRENSSYGSSDAYAAWIDAQGSLRSMIYLGGRSVDVGQGIAIDQNEGVWVAGYTTSTDFHGRTNEYPGGPRNGFLLRMHVVEVPRLSVAAACPSGGPIRIEWSGATPGGQAALIFARNTGSFTIPNNRPCAGTQLGLGVNQIQLAFQGGAGQNGSRTLNTNAGPGACGGYLQLLDLTTCGTSNVARVE